MQEIARSWQIEQIKLAYLPAIGLQNFKVLINRRKNTWHVFRCNDPLEFDRKHNEVNMDWIEIIQLKSFTGLDRDGAVVAFQQLSSPLPDANLREIDLFKSPNLENELSILINWHGAVPLNGKSGLGLQLASAFSEFGHIYHSGWLHSSRLAPKVL